MSYSTLKKIKATRRDIGNLVFHFTKRNESSNAFEVLKRIMKQTQILSSNGFVKGGHSVVSFTEAPISEIASYFNAQTLFSGHERLRYEAYGLAFKKDFIFKAGGRPVIYQTDSEYYFLPKTMQYRHVHFDLNTGVDLTWEREWRVECNRLNFTPSDCLIIVKNQEEANELIREFIDYEPEVEVEQDYDGTGSETVVGINHIINWNIISMELFGYEEL
jgi:hypothetical protein